MFNKTYIYAHVDEFCSPMYIGVGIYGRAWEQKNRDGCHRSWLEDLDYDYVEIWDSLLTKPEALIKERGYIRKYDPRFNLNERIR